jgi:hypothetical protein
MCLAVSSHTPKVHMAETASGRPMLGEVLQNAAFESTDAFPSPTLVGLWASPEVQCHLDAGLRATLIPQFTRGVRCCMLMYAILHSPFALQPDDEQQPEEMDDAREEVEWEMRAYQSLGPHANVVDLLGVVVSRQNTGCWADPGGWRCQRHSRPELSEVLALAHACNAVLQELLVFPTFQSP